MRKYIIAAFAFATLLAGSITFTACEDIDDVKELNLDRLLSPTNLSARVREKVNIELTWDAMNNAQSYVIEVFKEDPDFAGTSLYTFETGKATYTVTGLEGETEYAIRVKSIAEGINDSKWVSITRSTDAEQILQEVAAEDLAATEVTLRWPAGEYAQTIVITPGDITHNVTAEEIANGAATVTGLSGKTTYTAKLMNGNKTRGTATFTTPVDVGDAILIENSEELLEALSTLAGGETLALLDGTYSGVEGTLNFAIDKTFSIVPAQSGGEVILNGQLRLKAGVGLSLSNIILDGTGGSGDQAIIFTEDGANGEVSLEGCVLRNYTKGICYINNATAIDKLTFNNCLIYNVECNGGELFDSRKGVIKEFTLSNSTIYNSCVSRELIRMDDASGSFAGIEPVINIINNTLVGVSDGSSRRLLYVRFKGNSTNFKNNIVYGTASMFSDNSATAKPSFEGNNYYNCPNLIAKGEKGKFCDDSSSKTEFDPQFTDAASGNFTVGNAELKDLKIGDPRWLKEK